MVQFEESVSKQGTVFLTHADIRSRVYMDNDPY